MKRLLTALILVACTTAAFAATPDPKIFTARQLLQALNSSDPADTAFASGVIMGVSLGDDNVCDGNFTLGETSEQGALTLKMMARKYPEILDKPAAGVLRVILETDFVCSK